MSILPQHWSKKEITNVSPSRYNTSCFLALTSGVLVANHRQLAAFDVDRRLLQPGARHHTAFRPDGGSLSGATPTLSAQIISPSLCFFLIYLPKARLCGGFYLPLVGFSVRKCSTPSRVQSARAAEDEPPVCPLREDRLPDGESQLPGQGEWTNRGASPGSLFALHPGRGRAEAASGELGGGAGGCESQRERERQKKKQRERKDKKTFLWSVPKCNNKESIVQRGESLGSGAVQFSELCLTTT